MLTSSEQGWTPAFTMCGYKETISDTNKLKCEALPENQYSISGIAQEFFDCSMNVEGIQEKTKVKWVCDQV